MSPPIAEFQLKRATVTREGTFAGMASVFNVVDRQGDIIAPGAFATTIAALSRDGPRLPLLWQHDQNEPIGAITSMQETAGGLAVNGRVFMELRNAMTAHDLMSQGAAYLSIGFMVKGAERLEGGGRLIRGLDLGEVSVVSVPANPHARVTDVKSAILESPVAFEKAVRDALGLSNREAKRLSRGGWQALTKADDIDDTALATLAERLKLISKSLRVQP